MPRTQGIPLQVRQRQLNGGTGGNDGTGGSDQALLVRSARSAVSVGSVHSFLGCRPGTDARSISRWPPRKQAKRESLPYENLQE